MKRIIIFLAAFSIAFAETETIDWTHQKIHEGHMFQFIASTNGLASNVSINICIATTNIAKYNIFQHPEFHFQYFITTTGAAKVQLLKSPTVTGASVALTIYNLNDKSSATSLAYAASATNVSGGTVKDLLFIGTGGRFTGTGGGSGSRYENIFQTNLIYCIQVTSLVDGNYISVLPTWYEEGR